MHHIDKKISGALCACSTTGNTNFLSLGIGVNLNSSPVPEISTCLKEIAASESDISVESFIEELAGRVMRYFAQADRQGFEGELLESVQAKLEFLGEPVRILDEHLKDELHRGTFVGINRFGHA